MKKHYKNKRNFEHGFSIVELVVTIAIIAIVIPLISLSIRSFVMQSQLAEATTQLTADLTRARTSAVKHSTTVTVTLRPDSYTLTQASPFNEQTYEIRNNASLDFLNNGSYGTQATTIEYIHPYGEVDLPTNSQGWQIRVKKGTRERHIKIIGRTGKLIVKK